jgi:hypothetical protein
LTPVNGLQAATRLGKGLKEPLERQCKPIRTGRWVERHDPTTLDVANIGDASAAMDDVSDELFLVDFPGDGDLELAHLGGSKKPTNRPSSV